MVHIGNSETTTVTDLLKLAEEHDTMTADEMTCFLETRQLESVRLSAVLLDEMEAFTSVGESMNEIDISKKNRKRQSSRPFEKKRLQRNLNA